MNYTVFNVAAVKSVTVFFSWQEKQKAHSDIGNKKQIFEFILLF